MSRATLKKDHPLSMRLPDEDVAIIDRAARLRGRSRTDFVREAAVQEAELVLMEQLVVRMGSSGFRAFSAAITRSAKAVPDLVKVLKRRAPWKGD